MDEHTACEQAYKNGYAQGQRDAVKHGRWELEHETWGSCGVLFARKKHFLKNLMAVLEQFFFNVTSNSCPNCGAKMDLEVTDEAD